MIKMFSFMWKIGNGYMLSQGASSTLEHDKHKCMQPSSPFCVS